MFKDLKEVWGAGQQQLRDLFAGPNTSTCGCSWLVDRSASPWDDPARRPSHADRRWAGQRGCLREE